MRLGGLISSGKASLGVRANVIWYAVPRFLGKASAFLLLPLYTRVLPPSEFGVAVTVLAATGILGLVVAPGMEGIYLRWVYRRDSSGASRSSMEGTVVAMHLSFLVVGTALLLLFAEPVSRILLPGIPAWPFYYVALVSVALSTLGAPRQALWRVQHRADKVARLQLFHAVVSTTVILVALLVLEWGAVSILLGDLVAAIALTPFYLRPIVGGLRSGFDHLLLRSMAPIAMATALQTFASWGLSGLERLLLTGLAGPAELGVYAAGYQIGGVVFFAAIILNKEWQTLIFDLAAGPKTGRDVLQGLWTHTLCLFLVAGMLMSVFSRPIVTIVLGPDYSGSSTVIPFVAALGVLRAATLFPHNLSWAVGRLQDSTVAMLTAVGVLVAACVILIPELGAVGAAWSCLAAYLVHWLLLFTRSWNFFRLTWVHGALSMLFVFAAYAGAVGQGTMTLAVLQIAVPVLVVRQALSFWRFLGRIQVGTQPGQ